MQAPPDVVTYGTVIAAWAASGMKAHAVERVEQLLQDMQQKHGLQPNTVVYNAVMSAWVKSRNPACVNRTAEILHLMETSSSKSCAPDLISYNTHLHALSSQTSLQRPEYAQRCLELLERMEQQHDDASGKVVGSASSSSIDAPNLFSYNLVINAFCRSQQGLLAAHILRRLMQRGVEPDTFSFNEVLTALSKNNSLVEMAETLLWYMDDAYQSGLHADARPDVHSFATVIYAHSKAGNAQRAQQLLGFMKERVASQGQYWLKPNRFCYNAVISAWATSGQGLVGARKAEALLQEMQSDDENNKKISPNIFTYNAVLNAWARSGTRCCGVKAEYYLKLMWDLYNAGNVKVKPNDFSYNTVRLYIFCRLGVTERRNRRLLSLSLSKIGCRSLGH
jgi:pentatricopeptide repeat protein